MDDFSKKWPSVTLKKKKKIFLAEDYVPVSYFDYLLLHIIYPKIWWHKITVILLLLMIGIWTEQLISALHDVCWGWSFWNSSFSHMPYNSAETAGSSSTRAICPGLQFLLLLRFQVLPHNSSPGGFSSRVEGSSKGEDKFTTLTREAASSTNTGELLGTSLETSYHSLLKMCPFSPSV